MSSELKIEKGLLSGQYAKPILLKIDSINGLPALSGFDNSQKELTEKQKAQLALEIKIITNIALHPSMKALSHAAEQRVSFEEQAQHIQSLKKFIKGHKLNENLLEYFLMGYSDYHYDGGSEQVLSMKPNKDFPLVSALTIKYQANYLQNLGVDNTNINKYHNLNKKLESKKEELQSCNDADFIKSQLSEIKAEISNFTKKHKNDIMTFNSNKEIINQYVSDLGLTDIYLDINTPSVDKLTKKPNKMKM